MLTITAIKSPVFLMNIKAAALEAARNCDRNAPGIGFAMARNRNGKPAVSVVYRRAHGLEFFDMDDNDITANVLVALRVHHAEKRKSPALSCAGWMSAADIAHTFYPYGRTDSARSVNQL